MKKTTSRRLKIGGAVCAAVLACAALNPTLAVREYRLESGKISRELRIVQLSDLHDCSFGEAQSELIETVRAAKPDLIVLTGDMVDDAERALTDTPILYDGHPTRVLIEGIAKIAPIYAVLGNHEQAIERRDELASELESLGVRLISGREVVDVKGEPVALYGIDDPRFYGGVYSKGLVSRIADDSTKTSPSLERWRGALTDMKLEDAELSLLLSHRPEKYEIYFELGYDVTFSGHAHGGQWRLPGLMNGLYAPHQGLFPEHAGGLYERDGMYHIVSRGLSTARAPRIFNRPEVCVAIISPSA